MGFDGYNAYEDNQDFAGQVLKRPPDDRYGNLYAGTTPDTGVSPLQRTSKASVSDIAASMDSPSPVLPVKASTATPYSGASTGMPALNPGARKGGFIDWWNQLGDERKSALQTAALTTGLSLMAQGPSRYPVSAAEAIGKAGLTGLETYNNQMALSRDSALKDREMAMKEGEYALKRSADTREELKAPLERKRTEAEIGKMNSEMEKNNSDQWAVSEGYIYNKKSGERIKLNPNKEFSHNVNLGDRERIFYKDGTYEDVAKGLEPQKPLSRVKSEAQAKAEGETAGGKGSDKYDTAISRLEGLYKSRASIQKGYDPFTGEAIPQENITKSLDTINRQISDEERDISSRFPSEWQRRKGIAPPPKSAADQLKTPLQRSGGSSGSGWKKYLTE